MSASDRRSSHYIVNKWVIKILIQRMKLLFHIWRSKTLPKACHYPFAGNFGIHIVGSYLLFGCLKSRKRRPPVTLKLMWRRRAVQKVTHLVPLKLSSYQMKPSELIFYAIQTDQKSLGCKSNQISGELTI
ncbi:Hypothetical protein PAS_chr3_0025 [Komagataella phaffii GS115]|uniref:Uncharacterized protein n=1 Tax=Komagataella phaffii (strain GS115 / ATCC 20864) TaxID=644223 RepID=C4R3B9_KOMPG|nr:Hypothetical protein PAS_chr3_0025 [Komagataella phaffii GS115]CAY69954.1 Hypothetical protein PAS_chr3_0025 [Komagataella phaffii GS115]